jgi:hypothetical protein
MAQTSKSLRHLGSGWKPGTRLWKYLKNQLAQDSQFFCENLCDVRVTEAKMRFHRRVARIKSALQMNKMQREDVTLRGPAGPTMSQTQISVGKPVGLYVTC